MNKLRYRVASWHGEGGSIFIVVDTVLDEVRGVTSTRQHGSVARALADQQAKALNDEKNFV